MVQKNKDYFTFIDLFAGIGGFHLSLHLNGGKCLFASEWDKNARATYKQNFANISPDIFNNDKFFAGDIRKVNASEVPNHDILCAGFPCQPFSISGKQKGFEDERGNLFYEITRIIREKEPKVILLENVKNLIYHDNKRTFKIIIEELERLNYKVSWKILNSKDYGLAQNRERVFIVASKDKFFDFEKVINLKEMDIVDILDIKAPFEYLDKKDYTILAKKDWKTQKSGLIFCGYLKKKIREKGTRPNTNHLSRVHKQTNRIYSINGKHPTLSSQESSGRYWIYDGQNVRKITLSEAYKLQGFPDNFIKISKKSLAYNQIGNAVSISVVSQIIKQIKEQLL
jgi:DNA (cytosine-5)-methyltransferase 1